MCWRPKKFKNTADANCWIKRNAYRFQAVISEERINTVIVEYRNLKIIDIG